MRRFALLLLLAIFIGACGAGNPPKPTPATSSRPSSPVKVVIVSPTNGEIVHGSTVHVVVSVIGGTVTPTYSAHVSPTVGHVHLYLDNNLVYMSYTLQQDLPVKPGYTYSLYAEWVAADHFPYNPRDIGKAVVFQVASS